MAGNLFFYCGNDEYLLALHARGKVDELCPAAEQPLSLERIEGASAKTEDAAAAIDRCLAALRTVGLFGGRKVVWFRGVDFLDNATIMRNDQVKRLLGELAADLKAGLADDQFLVVSAAGIDRRSAFCKAIAKLCDIEEHDIPAREYEARPAAIQRAAGFFKSEGLAIAPAALDMFVGKTGFDTRQILNEVQKMAAYKRDEKQVEVEDVQAITSPSGEAVIWDFTDALAGQRLGEAIRLMRQLLFQKQSAVGLVIQVESHFHNLLRFREYMDAGWLRLNGNRIQWSDDPELDGYFAGLGDDPRKMHWFRASKLATQAARFGARHLAACKRLAIETHERMVSEGSVPHELLLETLLARLCAPRRKKR